MVRRVFETRRLGLPGGACELTTAGLAESACEGGTEGVVQKSVAGDSALTLNWQFTETKDSRPAHGNTTLKVDSFASRAARPHV